MNRVEFINELERLLSDLSPDERCEAIDYYNSYFDEAGEANESSVIGELGSPGKVAAIIKSDLKNGSRDSDAGEYTENGYTDQRFDDRQMPRRNEPNTGNFNSGEKYSQNIDRGRQNGYQGRKPHSTSTVVLIILLLVVCSPIILGIGSGGVGLIFGAMGFCIGINIALVVGGGGMIIGGIAMIIIGIINLFSTPGLGMIIIGIGFLMIAVGLFCIWLFVMLAFRLLPRFLRWFIGCIQNLINKKGGARTNE